MSERIEKLNSTLQEYIGEIIQKELDFNQEYLITITRVDTSPDVKHANVYISVLPDNRRGSAIDLLSRSAGRVKSRLYKLMKTKKRFFFRGGKYDEEQFESDLKTIVDKYGDKGHLEAEIAGTDLSYSDDGKRMYLTVKVNEGAQYHVGTRS